MQRVVAKSEADVALARKRNAAGLAYMRKDALVKAETAFQEALAADASYGAAHNNLGKVFLLQRRHYLAAGEFDQAAQLMPNRYEPLLNLGLVYENVERYGDAEHYYRIAYQMAPDSPIVIDHLARVRVRQQLFDTETKTLLEALVFHESKPDWVGWARELLGVKRFDGINSGELQPYQSAPVDMRLLQPNGPYLPPSVETIQPGMYFPPQPEVLPTPNPQIPTNFQPNQSQSLQAAPPFELTVNWMNMAPPWMVPNQVPATQVNGNAPENPVSPVAYGIPYNPPFVPQQPMQGNPSIPNNGQLPVWFPQNQFPNANGVQR